MMDIHVEWSELKQFALSRSVPIQYMEYYDSYRLIAIDGNLTVLHKMSKITPTPSGSDQEDFELNFKPAGNKSLTDSDGSPLARTKIAQTGWQYHMQGVEFTTSDLNSIYNKDVNGVDLGYATLKLYDSNDNEITEAINQINAVKTVIDWEPDYDYEVIGGTLKMASITATDARVHITAAPDIPKSMGGSKDFITCVNMKYIQAGDKVQADGRASKKLYYTPGLGTNKLRITMTHPAGYSHDFLMTLEIYKE